MEFFHRLVSGSAGCLLLDFRSRWMGLLWTACLVVGCASPVAINDRFAAENGYIRSVVEGVDFSHVIYTAPQGAGSVWHIYIEGDGQPWQSRTSVAHDPTSAKPLMLRLMQQDTAPRLYLGRPCYLGMVSETACKPWVWTHGRYSEPVVSSMRAVLIQQIERYGIDAISLIGHSGGGTLAMLLAERITQTQAVITLAANLDTRVWVREQGYSELVGSLNPADRPGLAGNIRQYHFLGSKDRVVPAKLMRNSSIEHDIIDGVGHSAGWETVYCKVLTRTGGRCRER